MRFATLKATVKLILWLLLAAATHARAQEALWPTHSSAPPPIFRGFAEFGDVSKTKYHTGLVIKPFDVTPFRPDWMPSEVLFLGSD